MKTPEEIKKGLECCVYSGSCKTCTYFGGEELCIGRLERDALDYIRQLEERSPTDAEPVQRGVWEWYEDWWHGECDEYGWRCSVCGVSLADSIEEAIGERPDLDDPDKVPTMKRCPNCEARMNVGEQVNADPRGKGWGYERKENSYDHGSEFAGGSRD